MLNHITSVLELNHHQDCSEIEASLIDGRCRRSRICAALPCPKPGSQDWYADMMWANLLLFGLKLGEIPDGHVYLPPSV